MESAAYSGRDAAISFDGYAKITSGGGQLFQKISRSFIKNQYLT